MFSFNNWADWLKAKADCLEGENYTLVRFHDSRQVPESASNRSIGLSLDSTSRIGSIVFWESGLCDIQVFDVSGEAEANIANLAMLEANDETFPKLFEQFMSYYPEHSG